MAARLERAGSSPPSPRLCANFSPRPAPAATPPNATLHLHIHIGKACPNRQRRQRAGVRPIRRALPEVRGGRRTRSRTPSPRTRRGAWAATATSPRIRRSTPIAASRRRATPTNSTTCSPSHSTAWAHDRPCHQHDSRPRTGHRHRAGEPVRPQTMPVMPLTKHRSLSQSPGPPPRGGSQARLRCRTGWFLELEKNQASLKGIAHVTSVRNPDVCGNRVRDHGLRMHPRF
jgi:hypothetical protein